MRRREAAAGEGFVVVEGGERQHRGASAARPTALVAATPSTTRHADVHQHNIGSQSTTAAATLVPSAHSPTMWKPNRSRRMPRRPARTSSWSSTSSTRIMAPHRCSEVAAGNAACTSQPLPPGPACAVPP